MKAVRSLCAEVWRVFADAPVVSRAAGAGDNAGPEKAYWATGPLRIDKSSALLPVAFRPPTGNGQRLVSALHTIVLGAEQTGNVRESLSLRMWSSYVDLTFRSKQLFVWH